MNMTLSPFDVSALHADYWRARRDWRAHASEVLPALATRRDLIHGARILHALYWADQMIRDAGDDSRWRYSDASSLDAHAGALAEVIGARHLADPRDVAARAAVMALGNVARDAEGRQIATRRTAPAPDAMDGARHEVATRRTNSGRTLREVKRYGAAYVIGADDAPARAVVRGQYVPAPCRYRRMVRQMTRRGLLNGARRVDVRPPVGAVLPDMLHQLGAHLLEHAPRRGSGRNAIAVEQLTARLYRMPAVSDVRQHSQVTPELAGADPRGWAIHRADMAGQTGVLALTQSLGDAETAPWRERLTLPAIRARQSEPVTPSALAASADGGYWRTLAPCWRPAPARYRRLLPERSRPYPDGAIWIGHRLTMRGALADTTRKSNASRGNRTRRTLATLTPRDTPASAEGWVTLAQALNRGERIAGRCEDGARWTLNRAPSGIYSSRVTSADGHVVKLRRRTADGIGRTLAGLLAS